MARIERITITLPADMVLLVTKALEGGDYASTNEIVREALRDWTVKRAAQLPQLASLKSDIDCGLDDVAAGRVRKFDAERIIAQGRGLLVSTP